MLKLNAIFQRKENDFNLKSCVVEKIITLSDKEYKEFSSNMLRDYDFIFQNTDYMYQDNDGIYHCLLVLSEGKDDGIIIESEGFNYARYSAFVPNAKQIVNAHNQTETFFPKLKDLLNCTWENVHLVHADVEINPATIVELSNDTMTDEGKLAWGDVLNANVARICEGPYGLQIELYNVNPQRLEDFSQMLAGYCSCNEYERWVAESAEVTSGMQQEQ